MKYEFGEPVRQASQPQARLEVLHMSEHNCAMTTLDDDRTALATYNGIGDTYSVELHAVPVVATVVREVPVEVDIDGIEELEVPLKTALYDDGLLLGGIDEDGELHQSLALWEHGGVQDPVDRFAAGLVRQQTLQAVGLEPIFAPQKAGSDVGKSPDAPKYTVVANGRQFGLSDVCANTSKRPSVLLYAEGPTEPVHFYQSKSHGVWRALLAQGESRDGRSGWLAKGMFGFESTADAPLALQKLFATLQAIRQPDLRRRRQEMTRFVPQIPEKADLAEDMREFSALAPAAAIMRAAGVCPISAYRVAPDIVGDEPPRTPGRRLFSKGSRPDFPSVIDSWRTTTAFYGEVVVRVVPSKDGAVHYGVYEARTANGRPQRWIGTAEIANVSLTALGLAQEWPALSKDITEPPIEYQYTKEGKNTGYGERSTVPRDFERYVTRALAAYRGRQSRKSA